MIYCYSVTTHDAKFFLGILMMVIDGIDSFRNMMFFDTQSDTGDDCIAIKSGKNPESNLK